MKLLKCLIKLYQILISPILGKNCRFYPTCSEFMLQSIEKYKFKGLILGIKRILKCHPFNKGGYDPVERWIK
ncbi:MAG: membrane protein insertion efficiency factor YidD [Candidatus Omnitrophica bacterium]|nr:membrane protein insertion efficiency factor YidD [Candidatus Omnitrophota bacterium]